MKRVIFFGLAASMAAAPAAAQSFASKYECVFTRSCSATDGRCGESRVSYELARAGGAWSVTDAFNGTETKVGAGEAMADAVSLRWRAGGTWNNEVALTELVLTPDGAAALTSIGRNDGRLGATVLSGRCEAPSSGDR